MSTDDKREGMYVNGPGGCFWLVFIISTAFILGYCVGRPHG